jgi:hypothetical protein
LDIPTPSTAEKTLWRGSVSHFHYLGKWLLAIILAIAAAGTFFFRFSESDSVLWIIRAALFGLAIVLALWIQLDRIGRKYAVTDRRVSCEYGIINKNSNEVRVQDVRSINLRKTGIVDKKPTGLKHRRGNWRLFSRRAVALAGRASFAKGRGGADLNWPDLPKCPIVPRR